MSYSPIDQKVDPRNHARYQAEESRWAVESGTADKWGATALAVGVLGSAIGLLNGAAASPLLLVIGLAVHVSMVSKAKSRHYERLSLIEQEHKRYVARLVASGAHVPNLDAFSTEERSMVVDACKEATAAGRLVVGPPMISLNRKGELGEYRIVVQQRGTLVATIDIWKEDGRLYGKLNDNTGSAVHHVESASLETVLDEVGEHELINQLLET